MTAQIIGRPEELTVPRLDVLGFWAMIPIPRPARQKLLGAKTETAFLGEGPSGIFIIAWF